MNTNGRHIRNAFIPALYEYLLIILPVLIYVSIEAIHKEEMSFVLTSPEWSIATIFLLFQGNSLYRSFLKKSGRKINEHFFGLVALLSFTMALLTLVNSFLALHENTRLSIVIRIALFCFTSASFLLAVTSAKFFTFRNGNDNH